MQKKLSKTWQQFNRDFALGHCVPGDPSSFLGLGYTLGLNQARRAGEKGESFPGPRNVWGPRHRSKILKRVFLMASF